MTPAWCPLCAGDIEDTRVEVHDLGREPHGVFPAGIRQCGRADAQRPGRHVHRYCRCGYDWAEGGGAGPGSDSPSAPVVVT